MSDTIKGVLGIGGKYFIILTAKQYKEIKEMNNGIEKLKWMANTCNLYIQGRKRNYKVIINDKGELELL